MISQSKANPRPNPAQTFDSLWRLKRERFGLAKLRVEGSSWMPKVWNARKFAPRLTPCRWLNSVSMFFNC